MTSLRACTIVFVLALSLAAVAARAAELPAAGEPAAAAPQVPPAADLELRRIPAPETARTVNAGKIAFEVAAPYWDVKARSDLEAMSAGGGCAGGQVPPNLLCVALHEDMGVQVGCVRGDRPFLMRDRSDLEEFVNAFTSTVLGQLGEQAQVLQSGYAERDGAIFHRLDVLAPLRAGPAGCAGAAAPDAGAPRRVHFVLMDLFVRPEGRDAINYRFIASPSEDAYAALERELELLLGSVRYTEPLAAEFFDPNAPEDKLLTEKEAKRAAGGGRNNMGWLLALVATFFVWMILRRRKSAQTADEAGGLDKSSV